jgi:phosphatidylglycerophosphatase C
MAETPLMTCPAPGPIAVFDLDGTLTVRDSFLPFLISYALRRRRFRSLVLLPVWLLGYGCRLLSARSVKERLLTSFLRNADAAQIQDHAEQFCQTWVARHLHPVGLARLREHQHGGHRVILLSASPSLYVHRIAKFLGIAEVICTQVGEAGGRCSGRIVGPNCKGEVKLDLLREYLQVRDAPADSYAYGDQPSDLPVLTWVRHGFLLRRGRCSPVGEGLALG